MIFDPHPCQVEIIDHLLDVDRNAAWAPMGTGKTSATLRALDILSLTESQPAIVFAPLRVARSTWPDEIEKWDNIAGEIQPIVGTESQRTHALFAGLRRGNASIFTTNYENAPWLAEALAKAGAGWPFGTVVADEATKLKSFRLRQGGKRARALGQVAWKAKRFIELTGTPAPNGLKDLWGQAWFLDKGERLGRTFDAFSSRWFRTGYDGYGLEPLPHARAEIEEKLRDLCLTIDHGLDVEAPIVTEIPVELPSKAMIQYREMEKTMFAEIESHGVEAFNAGARTMKCRQIANGMVFVDDKGTATEVHDVKIQALESIINEAAGAPVLVAYHFRPELERLKRHFPQGRELDANPDTIKAWNAGRIPILFAHPASAGHGLNLQDGGNIVAFLNLDWNLEFHDQIIERIGPLRQKQSGHERPVFIYYIMAQGTIDNVLLQRLHTKRDVQDLLLEAMRRRG